MSSPVCPDSSNQNILNKNSSQIPFYQDRTYGIVYKQAIENNPTTIQPSFKLTEKKVKPYESNGYREIITDIKDNADGIFFSHFMNVLHGKIDDFINSIKDNLHFKTDCYLLSDIIQKECEKYYKNDDALIFLATFQSCAYLLPEYQDSVFNLLKTDFKHTSFKNQSPILQILHNLAIVKNKPIKYVNAVLNVIAWMHENIASSEREALSVTFKGRTRLEFLTPTKTAAFHFKSNTKALTLEIPYNAKQSLKVFTCDSEFIRLAEKILLCLPKFENEELTPCTHSLTDDEIDVLFEIKNISRRLMKSNSLNPILLGIKLLFACCKQNKNFLTDFETDLLRILPKLKRTILDSEENKSLFLKLKQLFPLLLTENSFLQILSGINFCTDHAFVKMYIQELLNQKKTYQQKIAFDVWREELFFSDIQENYDDLLLLDDVMYEIIIKEPLNYDTVAYALRSLQNLYEKKIAPKKAVLNSFAKLFSKLNFSSDFIFINQKDGLAFDFLIKSLSINILKPHDEKIHAFAIDMCNSLNDLGITLDYYLAFLKTGVFGLKLRDSEYQLLLTLFNKTNKENPNKNLLLTQLFEYPLPKHILSQNRADFIAYLNNLNTLGLEVQVARILKSQPHDLSKSELNEIHLVRVSYQTKEKEKIKTLLKIDKNCLNKNSIDAYTNTCIELINSLLDKKEFELAIVLTSKTLPDQPGFLKKFFLLILKEDAITPNVEFFTGDVLQNCISDSLSFLEEYSQKLLFLKNTPLVEVQDAKSNSIKLKNLTTHYKAEMLLILEAILSNPTICLEDKILSFNSSIDLLKPPSNTLLNKLKELHLALHEDLNVKNPLNFPFLKKLLEFFKPEDLLHKNPKILRETLSILEIEKENHLHDSVNLKQQFLTAALNNSKYFDLEKYKTTFQDILEKLLKLKKNDSALAFALQLDKLDLLGSDSTTEINNLSACFDIALDKNEELISLFFLRKLKRNEEQIQDVKFLEKLEKYSLYLLGKKNHLQWALFVLEFNQLNVKLFDQQLCTLVIANFLTKPVSKEVVEVIFDLLQKTEHPAPSLWNLFFNKVKNLNHHGLKAKICNLLKDDLPFIAIWEKEMILHETTSLYLLEFLNAVKNAKADRFFFNSQAPNILRLTDPDAKDPDLAFKHILPLLNRLFKPLKNNSLEKKELILEIFINTNYPTLKNKENEWNFYKLLFSHCHGEKDPYLIIINAFSLAHVVINNPLFESKKHELIEPFKELLNKWPKDNFEQSHFVFKPVFSNENSPLLMDNKTEVFLYTIRDIALALLQSRGVFFEQYENLIQNDSKDFQSIALKLYAISLFNLETKNIKNISLNTVTCNKKNNELLMLAFQSQYPSVVKEALLIFNTDTYKESLRIEQAFSYYETIIKKITTIATDEFSKFRDSESITQVIIDYINLSKNLQTTVHAEFYDLAGLAYIDYLINLLFKKDDCLFEKIYKHAPHAAEGIFYGFLSTINEFSGKIINKDEASPLLKKVFPILKEVMHISERIHDAKITFPEKSSMNILFLLFHFVSTLEKRDPDMPLHPAYLDTVLALQPTNLNFALQKEELIFKCFLHYVVLCQKERRRSYIEETIFPKIINAFQQLPKSDSPHYKNIEKIIADNKL